jgi:anaerobic magnesium-protoporphyrin IX monomethyl ester cyclase
MKVALVFPRYKYPSGDAPLGVLYLATYLQHQGFKVDVVDTTFHKDKETLLKMFQKKSYDLVGISLMTTMLKDAYDVASLVKKLSPRTKVVFGGPHPTVMPSETLQNPNVDAVAIGEGEETWLELLRNQADFRAVAGLWYKEDGSMIKNPPREPIDDLDKLPFPNQELVDLDNYFRHWFQLDSVARNLKGVNIIASRGCPYNCSFCQPTLNKLFGKKVRKRSAGNIVSELQYWKKRHNINAFMFQDDTLIFDKEWVSGFCDALIESQLGLKWGCNARANLVDYDTFAKMKKAGLRKVFMGVESGSQRILDQVYQKGIRIKQVEDAVRILKSLNLKVQGYFMLGAPTETTKEVMQTIGFARSLDIDEATFSITTPLPETFLYDKTKHLIADDIADFDYYKNPVFVGEKVIPRDKLRRLKRQALLSFYLAPRRIHRTLEAFATPVAIKKSLLKLQRF